MAPGAVGLRQRVTGAGRNEDVLLLASTMVVAALVRVLFFLHFAKGHDAALVGGGDGAGYYELARHLVAHHNVADPLFMVRPPGFPALSALAMVISGSRSAWVLIVLNMVLSTIAVGLTYVLARALRLGPHRSALAALIVAIDPAAAFLGVTSYSDTLLTVLVIGSMLGAVLARRFDRSIPWAVLSGACIALGMLTKPVVLAFGVLLALFLAVGSRKFAAALVVCLFAGGTYVGWIAVNETQWGTLTYSSIGTWTLYFYRCTSILHHETGESPVAVEQQLADRLSAALGRPSARTMSDYLTATDARTINEMNRLAVECIEHHLTTFFELYPIGVVRMGFISQDGQVPQAPLTAFFVVLYGLVLVSARRWWQTDRWFLVLAALSVLYFVLVATTVETAPDVRMLEPLVPVLAILAVGGLPTRWMGRLPILHSRDAMFTR